MHSDHERLARWRQRVWQSIQRARTQRTFVAAALQQPIANSEHLATFGWRALRDDDRARAEAYFRAALHYDPYMLTCWVGLSRAAQSREERRLYVQAALDLRHLVYAATQTERARGA